MKLFPESWSLKPINKVCSEVVDCINKTAPIVDEPTGFKMIRTTNVRNGRVNLEQVNHVTEKTFAKWTRRATPRKFDVILTREAPLGEVGMLRSDDRVFLGQRTVLYRANNSDLNQWFLYYSLIGPVLQGQIRSLGSGSTVEHLRVPHAETLKIPLPPLPQQKKIAAILSAYDELIENNKRRIALLEKMAEEIYREWFVRMRFPGHKAVKVSKGLPAGWSLEPFNKLVKIDPPERIDRSEELPFVPMEQLSTTSMYFASTEVRKGASGAKFRNRDVLFPRITPSVENGKRGFVMTLPEGQVAVGSTEFIVIRERVIGPEHIYFLTCLSEFRKHAELSMTGASGRQRVQDDCFSFFLVKTPPKELRDRFSSVVRPHFDQVRLLSLQIDVLQKARDALLPRLISGKLSVENLDIQFPPSMQKDIISPAVSRDGRGGKAARGSPARYA